MIRRHLKIQRKIFTFTIFTIATEIQLSRRFLIFSNPDMANYENLDRSELEWFAWSRAGSLIKLLSTWENLCIGKVSLDIGKHNFQGEHFSIIFSLINPFSIRNRSWKFLKTIEWIRLQLWPEHEVYDFKKFQWWVNEKWIETWHVELPNYRHAKSNMMQLMAAWLDTNLLIRWSFLEEI